MSEHVAVIVSTAVTITQRNHRSWAAGSAQLDLRRLQPIVVIDSVNKTVTVGFGIHRKENGASL